MFVPKQLKIVICIVMVCLTLAINTFGSADTELTNLGGSIDDNICVTITNNKDLKMRAVLLFPKRLYIITKSWFLYSITMKSDDDIENMGLNLINVTSQPIGNVWTAFTNNREFKEIKSNIINIYSFDLNNRSYAMLNVPNKNGLKYDVDKNEISTGFYYNSTDFEKKIVAPITGSRFFTMEYAKPHGDLVLVWWTFYISTKTGTFQANTTKRQYLYYSSTLQKVRLYNKTETKIKPGYVRMNSTFAQVINGITKKDRFILFTPRKILNFSEAVINPDYEVHISFSNMTNFFICSKTTILTEAPTNATTPINQKPFTLQHKTNIMMIGGIVFVVAIIVGFTIFYLYSTSSKKMPSKKHKNKNAHHKNKSKPKLNESISKNKN